MAELVDQLKLDIDQALRQIDDVGRAIDRALASVELRIDPTSVDNVRQSADQVARAFDQAEDEARSLDRATGDVERNLAESEREARGFERALERADSEARDLDASTGRVAGSFASLRGVIGGLAVGFGAFAAIRGIVKGLGDLIESFVAFDQAITESLAIVSNVTPQLRAQFEDVARTVATTLRFSAAEAGEAFFFLASAGFDATQQLALLPQVAEFAQAGMFDLSTATSLLADSQSALGLRTKDANQTLQSLTRVADVLTKANILSNASVQQFAEALTNDAAAAARLVGVEVEETVGVLAVFADQGTKGAAAGTAFAIVLRDLQRAALDQPEAFADLGVAVFDAVGEFRPFADIIGELEVALAGMSDQQVRATVTALGFQDRSVQNLLTLLGTSEAIRSYTRGLQDASGATEELANKQLLSLGARLDIAKNKFEDAKISLGEELVPAVEAFVEILPRVIEAARNLAPAIADIATAFGDAAPGIASFMEQILRFVEAAPRSAGIAGEIGSIATVPLGTTVLALETIGDLLLGNFGEAGQDVEDIVTGITGIGDSIDNIQFDRLEQGLQDSIREGRDSVIALGSALRDLDEGEGGATFANIARLARVAGVEGKDLANVFKALITNARGFGLSAQQVAGFELALRDMTETADRAAFQQQQLGKSAGETGTAVEQAADRITAAQDPISEFFSEVESAIGESGASIAQFVLFGGELTESLLNALSPADRLSVVLGAIGSDAEAAAGAFADKLTPTIRDAQQALIDFNEDGKISLNEFIRGLGETLTATLAFNNNLAAILASGAPGALDLFDFLKDLPDQAQAALLAQEAVSTGRIEETAAALLGDPEELAASFNEIANEAIGIFRREGAPGVATFAEGIAARFPDSPEVIALIGAKVAALQDDIGFQIEQAFTQDDATNRAAGITADAYDNEIIRRIGVSNFVNGTDIFDFIEAGLTQEEAARLGATTTAEAYVAGLIEDLTASAFAIGDPVFDLFDIDVFALGQESRATYLAGLSTASGDEVGQLRTSITNTLDSAIQRDSPPKLFLDIGKESGDAFWSGFNQSELTLRTPATPITGSIATAATGQVAGGVNVNLNINNPSVNDAVSDAARLGQIASSIATTYRSVT